MINLKQYFLDNVKNDEYFYRFNESIVSEERINDCTILDDEEAINNFKKLIQPGFESNISNQDNLEFILLCYYLYKHGYTIKQFPSVLSKPISLSNFGYDTIRSYIGGSPVAWADRRRLIADLQFVKNNYDISCQINDKIKLISTRNASFEQMSQDEKLEALCNLIEYLLKDNGKFISLINQPIFDILDDSKIKQYRNRLECFRHTSKESLQERSNYSDFEKDFLIRYGIFIIETINNKINS